MKSLVREIARRAGFTIQPISPMYGSRGDFVKAADMVRNYTMLPELRLVSLYDQAKYCTIGEISGDLVKVSPGVVLNPFSATC